MDPPLILKFFSSFYPRATKNSWLIIIFWDRHPSVDGKMGDSLWIFNIQDGFCSRMLKTSWDTDGDDVDVDGLEDFWGGRKHNTFEDFLALAWDVELVFCFVC